MGKLILWIVVVLVALTIARIIAHANARNGQRGKPAQGRRGARQAARNVPAEHMVRCAHCGIHLPRSEAMMTGGETWCSPEHARLGVKR